MPTQIRFHLDEHVDHAIAEGLGRRGIDVTTATQAGLLHADDIDHIAFCRREGRVMVTHDQDFVRLHAEGVTHPGIAFCRQQSRNVGVIVSGLVLIWGVMTPEEMTNHIEYL